MQSLGTLPVCPRTLLRRAGLLAGTTEVGFPPLAQAGVDEDLAEVRLVCATKRLTIAWYTDRIDSQLASANDLPRSRRLRRQEEASYGALAPLLGRTAPVDDDFGFAFPPGALRSVHSAHALGVALERLALGVEPGAASRIGDPLVAGPVAAIGATNAMHLTLLTGALADRSVALTADDASARLAEYLQ
jgi:hypothetical protein